MSPALDGALTLAAWVVLALVGAAGCGCAAALLRVVLPALARKADRSLESLGTGRLVVTGVLPLVGALAISAAASKTHLPPAVVLVVWVPLLLLVLAGATAALPHVGARLMRGGEGTSLLGRCAGGGVVVGLSMATWLFWPVGLLVSLLLAGWALGIGFGLWSQDRGSAV